MYGVIGLGCHWYCIEPISTEDELPAEPTNLGAVPAADYQHLNSIAPLPGSSVTLPMLVR